MKTATLPNSATLSQLIFRSGWTIFWAVICIRCCLGQNIIIDHVGLKLIELTKTSLEMKTKHQTCPEWSKWAPFFGAQHLGSQTHPDEIMKDWRLTVFRKRFSSVVEETKKNYGRTQFFAPKLVPSKNVKTSGSKNRKPAVSSFSDLAASWFHLHSLCTIINSFEPWGHLA